MGFHGFDPRHGVVGRELVDCCGRSGGWFNVDPLSQQRLREKRLGGVRWAGLANRVAQGFALRSTTTKPALIFAYKETLGPAHVAEHDGVPELGE